MKIGCDNTVLRMVSSGKHINRVTFEYYQLDLQEIENRKENSIEEFCFPSIWETRQHVFTQLMTIRFWQIEKKKKVFFLYQLVLSSLSTVQAYSPFFSPYKSVILMSKQEKVY